MRRSYKLRFAVIALVVMTLLQSVCAVADTLPYDSYNYDSREDIVFTPAPYVPGSTATGLTTGAGAFKNPQDMAVNEDLGIIVVADTGNNRIVILDEAMTTCLKIVEGYTAEDGSAQTFKTPSGVFVTEDHHLYIADSDNKRVVALDMDNDYAWVRTVENPTSEVLGSDFNFVPLKVLVDYAGRLYVINKGETAGIMAFDVNGNFTSFFGTIEISISTWERIWRRIRSKTQSQTGVQNIATEFTGMDIDPDGFVYATNVAKRAEQAVRRLNPKGEDVIRNGEAGVICGDLVVSQNGSVENIGPSVIQDVVYRSNGIYSIVDSKRGRVFTYDHEGNILYIFGGKGNQDGTFRTPAAIDAIGDRILVLDAGYGSIIVFEETEYGRLINEAVSLRYEGDETKAVEIWKEVLKYNENFELANAGIGKAYLTAGENELAMKYLKLGMSRRYYSVAYKRYRNEILKEYLNYILTALALVIIVIIFLSKYLKKRKVAKKMQEVATI